MGINFFKFILLIGFCQQLFAASQAELQIKNWCKNQYGSSLDRKHPYQQCLRTNGIIAVDANANSGDKSQTDAIVCDVQNPVCQKCLDQYAPVNVEAKVARTGVMNCIATAEKKTATATNTANATNAVCSSKNVEKCTTAKSCHDSHGIWDIDRDVCQSGFCPNGSVNVEGDISKCRCTSDSSVIVDRGSHQACPNHCGIADDNLTYDRKAKKCVCKSGFVISDTEIIETCVPEKSDDKFVHNRVDACLAELQQEAAKCSDSSSAAVQRCNAKKSQDGDDDEGSNSGITVMQGILSGANGFFQAKNAGTGAVQNCMNAAIASSTGYYALEQFKDTCDNKIGSCKSSCEDAEEYIEKHKAEVYLKCRRTAYGEAGSVNESKFNADFDKLVKANFESQVAELEKNISDSDEKCETGTAVTNRAEMEKFMDDMNSSVKNANLCSCQLSSAGANCANQVGPAECKLNPTHPGCALATINCLGPGDNSQKCVCFKNPNGSACKSFIQSNIPNLTNLKPIGFASGFPGGPNGSPNSSDQKPTDKNGNIDLSGINADEATKVGSGTTTSANNSSASPFGVATGGGSGGGSGAGFGGSGSSDSGLKAIGDDENINKGIRGLFNTAKSALASVFGGKGSSVNSANGKDSSGRSYENKNANGEVDPTKWRPKPGAVRGIAGTDELAGKYEDIWKVMSKQYKVQDQKNTFYFGGEN